MPGTDLTPDQRVRLVDKLTLAGWLLLGGSFGFLAFQLDRVRGVGEQRFASIWDQRIEVLSFLVLPPNLVVLAPPVSVAMVAVWLAGPERNTWLSTLLRLCAALAITYAAIGIASVVSIMLSDEPGVGDFASVMLRIGGVSLAAGLALLCRIADQHAT